MALTSKHGLSDFQPAWEEDKNIRIPKPASIKKGKQPDVYITSLWEGWGTLRLTVAVFEQGSDEGVAIYQRYLLSAPVFGYEGRPGGDRKSADYRKAQRINRN